MSNVQSVSCSPIVPTPVAPSQTGPTSTASSHRPIPSSAARDAVPAWHAGFLQLLPAIEMHARVAFRKFKREARDEAVQKVTVNAMAAYARLVQLGKQDVAYASPLARYAIAQYRDGRLVANKLNVRDVSSFYCQRHKGVVVERLDRWDYEEECWQEVLVEDRSCTPAELAASRIDFLAWLASLSSRDRKVAKLLASGLGTSEVAPKVGLSWSRISQMRRELRESWERFHEPRTDEVSGNELDVAA